jgi:hypothetical protein
VPALLNLRSWRAILAAAVLIVALTAITQYAMGRVPICTCGYVKLWHGIVVSSENSQHLSDWYTPSHVIHGIAFYLLFWAVGRRWQPGTRFVAAVALEAGWEILENTPLIINRYRAATIALDYYGDSIVNSMADIVSMMTGYLIARQSPVWVSVAFIVAMEALVAALIRDNLTLNIIMLVWPVEAIRQWQSGG